MIAIFELIKKKGILKKDKNIYYSVFGSYIDGTTDLHIIETIINENKNENPRFNLKLKYEWLKENHPELLI